MTRFFDIIFSLMALLVLLPLFAVVSVLLRLTGERKIIYVQNRIGLKGQDIPVYKFVTMLENSPNMGSGTITLKDDPRVLPLGRFLRLSKINELPQLFNVLKGNLSIIGPRPQDVRCFLAFPETKRPIITSVLPGLSGIGSIVFRNEELLLSNAEDYSTDYYDSLIMPYKAELEEWYVNNQSIYLYFRLIILTVLVVLMPKKVNVWSQLKTVPIPPEELRTMLDYSS